MCALLSPQPKAHVIQSLRPHHTGAALHRQADNFYANPDSLPYCQITNRTM